MPSEKGSGGDCHHKAVSTNRAYDAVLLDDLGVLSATVDGSLLPCVARLREHGLLTAVLSNADGPPRSGLEGLGPVLLSGRTGLRKPDPAAYVHAAAVLGVPPGRCVVVDDLAHNVRGAVAAGMTGVHHVGLERTLVELEALLGVRLR